MTVQELKTQSDSSFAFVNEARSSIDDVQTLRTTISTSLQGRRYFRLIERMSLNDGLRHGAVHRRRRRMDKSERNEEYYEYLGA